MSPRSSRDVAEALATSTDEVLAAAKVPESLANRKPGEGRWSVLDCMEHLVRMEGSFLDRLARVEGAALPEDSQKESELAARMVDRMERRQSPDALRPTGRFATLASALEAFQSQRRRAAEFAKQHAAELGTFSASSPRWGVLNGREVLLLIAGHSLRHAAQIRETVRVLTMGPKAGSEIAEILRQSRDELLAAANVPEPLAHVKPAEGRWSVLDCVEHVTTVEQLFLSRLQSAEGDAPPADPSRELQIMERAIDRTTPRQGPEAAMPKGKFATLAEALAEFDTVRARTAQFAEEHASVLYALTVVHPVFGLMNGREALILIAGHSRRHAAQMREAAAVVASH